MIFQQPHRPFTIIRPQQRPKPIPRPLMLRRPPPPRRIPLRRSRITHLRIRQPQNLLRLRIIDFILNGIAERGQAGGRGGSGHGPPGLVHDFRPGQLGGALV